MSSYKAKAIIVKTYKLGEADKILRLYSQGKGMISAVAKGARRLKSRFGGRLETFNVLDLEISVGKSLDIINQAEILYSFKNIPEDFNKFAYCEIISNIVLKTQVIEDEFSEPVFKLLFFCFKEIDETEVEDIVSLKKIFIFFEARFLQIAGYKPLTSICSKCNKKMDDLYSFHKSKIAFSIKNGGIICKDCIGMDDGVIILNASDYRLLCDIFDLKVEDLRGLQVDNSSLGKIGRLLDNYMVYHINCPPANFKYLKKIGI